MPFGPKAVFHNKSHLIRCLRRLDSTEGTSKLDAQKSAVKVHLSSIRADDTRSGTPSGHPLRRTSRHPCSPTTGGKDVRTAPCFDEPQFHLVLAMESRKDLTFRHGKTRKGLTLRHGEIRLYPSRNTGTRWTAKQTRAGEDTRKDTARSCQNTQGAFFTELFKSSWTRLSQEFFEENYGEDFGSENTWVHLRYLLESLSKSNLDRSYFQTENVFDCFRDALAAVWNYRIHGTDVNKKEMMDNVFSLVSLLLSHLSGNSPSGQELASTSSCMEYLILEYNDISNAVTNAHVQKRLFAVTAALVSLLSNPRNPRNQGKCDSIIRSVRRLVSCEEWLYAVRREIYNSAVDLIPQLFHFTLFLLYALLDDCPPNQVLFAQSCSGYHCLLRMMKTFLHREEMADWARESLHLVLRLFLMLLEKDIPLHTPHLGLEITASLRDLIIPCSYTRPTIPYLQTVSLGIHCMWELGKRNRDYVLLKVIPPLLIKLYKFPLCQPLKPTLKLIFNIHKGRKIGREEASQSRDALAETGPPLTWPQPPPADFLHLPLSHSSQEGFVVLQSDSSSEEIDLPSWSGLVKSNNAQTDNEDVEDGTSQEEMCHEDASQEICLNWTEHKSEGALSQNHKRSPGKDRSQEGGRSEDELSREAKRHKDERSQKHLMSKKPRSQEGALSHKHKASQEDKPSEDVAYRVMQWKEGECSIRTSIFVQHSMTSDSDAMECYPDEVSRREPMEESENFDPEMLPLASLSAEVPSVSLELPSALPSSESNPVSREGESASARMDKVKESSASSSISSSVLVDHLKQAIAIYSKKPSEEEPMKFSPQPSEEDPVIANVPNPETQSTPVSSSIFTLDLASSPDTCPQNPSTH
ncbi:unnamed protein product [Darwinula stevensoni]|uniref:Uncharacterized protein n=1 Tax=Darwinula stevensoni TaxID=69355 RepID=A0A7R9A9H5_9CRUS|nr:unnamed protein product [Darwinula stevensoni]CAG0897434.1 unnamed protein product [Darwinula stevensoni]